MTTLRDYVHDIVNEAKKITVGYMDHDSTVKYEEFKDQLKDLEDEYVTIIKDRIVG